MNTSETSLAVAAIFVDQVHAGTTVHARVRNAFIDVGHAGFSGVSRFAVALEVVDFIHTFSFIFAWLALALIYLYTNCGNNDENISSYFLIYEFSS